MELEKIKTLLYRIEKLMYGYNYEVTLGIEIFEGCSNISLVNKSIKRLFPDSNPEQIEPTIVLESSFWQVINETFDYRGESPGVALILNKQQELTLLDKQHEYKTYLSQFINQQTRIYDYKFLEGIPGYPVFWDYAFVIVTDDEKCILIYGSSSD